MGQRLVVTIKNNEKDLAKIYYHWSAYTVSALLEAKKLVDCIYNHNNETEKELQLRLIRFCEANGGGIDSKPEEFEYIQKMFPDETFKTEGYSRNQGLIALSEDGMDDMQSWSEGDLDIIIDEDVIINSVFWGGYDFEEYKELAMENDEDFNPNTTIFDIPDIGYDLSEIDIEDLDNVINALCVNREFVVRYGNEIFELIS